MFTEVLTQSTQSWTERHIKKGLFTFVFEFAMANRTTKYILFLFFVLWLKVHRINLTESEALSVSYAPLSSVFW